MWLIKFYIDATNWALPLRVDWSPRYFGADIFCFSFYWWKVTRETELANEAFKPIPDGIWECKVCGWLNIDDDQECMDCDAPRPA